MAENKPPHFLFKIFIAGSTAILIAGPLIGLLLLGLWLDGLFGTSPLFVITGVLMAVAITVVNLLKFLKTLK